jgi:hypothetical protein
VNIDQKYLKAAAPGEDPLAPRPGDKTRSEVRRPSEAFREGYEKIRWGPSDE